MNRRIRTELKVRFTLRDSIESSCVIAHKEDTVPLEKALGIEGFRPVTQRLSLSDKEKQFSGIVRCLLNHRQAWERASQVTGLSLIIEADFVPCRGFGRFALPIPASEMHRAAAWLYLCAGRFTTRVEGRF
jgi:hypothetical protein